MLSCDSWLDILDRLGLRFYTGVPDSLLKDPLLAMNERIPAERHVIAANEGNAVAIATGHYLATGNPALVYLQNSGLGNALNPLASLASPAASGIPMLLMVGWRGEPNQRDEPQHMLQGSITPATLDLLGIPWGILSSDEGRVEEQIRGLMERSIAEKPQPFALLIRKGTFASYSNPRAIENPENHGEEPPEREGVIGILLEALSEDDVVVATTGKTGREVFAVRKRCGGWKGQDFLNVGAMGHASSIALGLAIGLPQRKVICIDGDGAALMHLGAMATIGSIQPANFIHILLNNTCHESVGGQPTTAPALNFAELASVCGYRTMRRLTSSEQLGSAISRLTLEAGPAFLEVMIRTGSRPDLERPDQHPTSGRESFMRHLGSRQ